MLSAGTGNPVSLSRWVHLTARAVLVCAAITGCSQPPADSTASVAAVGTIHAQLAAGIPGQLAAVRIDVSQNGTLVQSQTLPLATTADTSVPTGAPAADAFFVLPVGTYAVSAVPLDANGRPAPGCDGTSAQAAVAAAQTTELSLLVACQGTPTGGLDVSVNVDQPPTITGLEFDPGKFAQTCDNVEITVDAEDSAGQALSYRWSIVSAPTPTAAQTPPSTRLVPNGTSATFFTDLAGDYSLSVTVTDSEKLSATLNFPLHIIQGPTATCNPTFDQLNVWVPNGPATPGLVYGNRVHVMPATGVPDPMCHLTRHDDNPTVITPNVVPVLWGPTISSDEANLTTMFNDLLSNQTYSGYLRAIADEYQTGATGTVTVPSGSPNGWMITPNPSHTSSSWSAEQVQNELVAQMNDGAFLPRPDQPGVRTIYAIYFPPTVTLTLDSDVSCNDFLAYHGTFTFEGVTATFLAIGACGDAATLQDEGSHELIETLTDPEVGEGILTWYDDTDTDPACNGEIGDLCETDPYQLGSYTVQSSWSNADQSCRHAAVTPSQDKLQVTFTNVNFHTTGFSVFDHNPNFHALNPGDGVFTCIPGNSPIVRQLGCFDGAGYFATVRCNPGTNGFIDGSVEFDISSDQNCVADVPEQDFETLVGDSSPTSMQTPLGFSASSTQPYASTSLTACAADDTQNVPGSCTCPATSQSNDECHRALNVCFSGSNVGSVDPCSRQEIAADISAVIVTGP